MRRAGVSVGGWVVVWFGTLGLALTALTLPSPTHAQEDRYRHLAEQATAAVTERRYDEAFSYFREMHVIQPSARTLWSLGRVRYEQERFVDALHYLEQALADERRALEGEARAEAEALRDAARSLTAEVTLVTEPDDALVLVDDAPVEGRVVRLNPGEHRIQVEASGFRSALRRLELRAGERRRLEVRLEAEGADAPLPVIVAPPPAALPTPAGGLGLGGRGFLDHRDRRLEVQASEPLTLHLLRLAEDMRPVGERFAFCEAPCDQTLRLGHYRFAVERGDGRVADGTTILGVRSDLELQVEYWDRDGTREAGAILGIVSGVLTLVSIVAALAYFDANDGLGIAGSTVGAIAAGSLAITGLAMFSFVHDLGVVRVISR